jgi:hypothetical protein
MACEGDRVGTAFLMANRKNGMDEAMMMAAVSAADEMTTLVKVTAACQLREAMQRRPEEGRRTGEVVPP